MLALAMANGVTVPFTKDSVNGTKPVAVAKSMVASMNISSRSQIPVAHRAVVRPVAASAVQPAARNMKSAGASIVPGYPQQQQLASKAVPATVGFSAKVKSREQATKPLLPIGEGAYQSAEAVAQRTLDADRHCEEGKWDGCLHKDKADIVDGHSYGNLRGGKSAASEAADAGTADAGTADAGAADAGAADSGKSADPANKANPGDSNDAANSTNPSSSGHSPSAAPSPDPLPAGRSEKGAEKGSEKGNENGAEKGTEKGSAAGCLKGLVLTSFLLSLVPAAQC